jgi:hypothetical protein
LDINRSPIADTRVSDPHELNQHLAPDGIEATPWAASDTPQGTTFLELRLSPRTGAAAAEAAVRSLQAAHPVLLAHIRAASTSSPTLAFPISSAHQLPFAPHPSEVDFDTLLEHELNRNPWAAAEPGPDGNESFFFTY